MTAPGRPGGTAADVTVLGLLGTGGLDLALPLSVLREVVPCPEQLTDLPVDAVGLLGAMTLRSTLVPVVDLVQVLGRPHPRRPGQVVVVVAEGGLLVGLLVDEVKGLAAVERTAFAEVACHGDGLLFSRTFHHPELGHLVSTVDAAAVLSLPGVPVVRDTRGHATATGATAAGPSRSLTVVRCGATTLALDVSAVHATVPSPELAPSPADGPTCLGATTVAGAEVAVVDLLALLGLGSLQGEPLACGLVLDLPAGQVVLGVSAMLGLRDVPEADVVPLPAVTSPSPLLAEIADVEGVGACLLVDPAGLLAHEDVVTLSRLTTVADGAGDAGTAGREGALGPAHLAYRAGVGLASPLSQVSEVLAWPEDLVVARAAPDVLGVVVHRGAAVPVLCLAGVLGRAPDPVTASSRLLLVDVDGAPVAYAVSALTAIHALAWSDPAPPRQEAGRLAACPLVQLDAVPGLLPALDLVALTRELRGGAPALPSPRPAPTCEERAAPVTS